jgi:hypothetical protein
MHGLAQEPLLGMRVKDEAHNCCLDRADLMLSGGLMLCCLFAQDVCVTLAWHSATLSATGWVHVGGTTKLRLGMSEHTVTVIVPKQACCQLQHQPTLQTHEPGKAIQ